MVGGEKRTKKALDMWANGAAEGKRHQSPEAVEGKLVPSGTDAQSTLLQVGGGDPGAGKVCDRKTGRLQRAPPLSFWCAL